MQPGASSREQLRHDVATVIRNQIITRQARPGDIIRLSPIAEEMDISVTPVREALLMLAQDGWVAQEPNRGFRVLATKRSDIKDIYLMWAWAEAELAARAAKVASAEQISILRDIDDRLNHLDDPSKGQLALALNSEMHSTIHRMADAPKLEWFTHASRRLVPYDFSFEFFKIPGWWELNRGDHTPVVNAIERRDEMAAHGSMKQHVVATGDLLVVWLDSISFWEGHGADPPSEVGVEVGL